MESIFGDYTNLDYDQAAELANQRGIPEVGYRDDLIYTLEMYDRYVDRIIGMLFGVALGDAKGFPHEFRNSIPVSKYTGNLIYSPMIPSRFQGQRHGVIGQVSDDTEMTLALANSLLATTRYHDETTIQAYQDWANSRPIGMGRNTRRLFAGVTTIKGYKQRYMKAIQDNLMATQSNGSLMRISPLALIVNLEDISSFDSIIDDTCLSNPNPINVQASLIYITMMSMALRGYDVDIILDEGIQLGQTSTHPEINQVISDVEEGLFRNVAINKGWVCHSLYAAMISLRWYQHYLDQDDPFCLAMNHVILLGGDTDTNAAIAGGLLGAITGYIGLKHQDGSNLDRLIQAKTEDGDFPRPSKYHPSIIPKLAKELARAFPMTLKDDFKV